MPSPLSDAVPLAEVKRALVTKLRHHGDVLLASPVFTTLKAVAPHAEVDALIYRDTAPMLEGHPSIARLFTVDRDWKHEGVVRQLTAERALIRELRGRRYDLLVHLTEHKRGLALVRRLRPRWSVTTERALERGPAWLWKQNFTHFYRLPRTTERAMVEQNLDALRRLGVEVPADTRAPVMVPGADAEARVDALLRERGLARGGFAQGASGIALVLQVLARRSRRGAGRPPRRGRPAGRAHRRARRARARDARRDPRAGPRDAAARIVDLGGALSLRELAALTSRARCSSASTRRRCTSLRRCERRPSRCSARRPRSRGGRRRRSIASSCRRTRAGRAASTAAAAARSPSA
jgi:heptosyltransferase-3